MFKSLRTQLTVIVIGLAILPLLVVSMVIAQIGFNTLEQEAIATQSKVAGNVSTAVENLIRSRESEIKTTNRAQNLPARSIDAQEAALNSLLFRDTDFLAFTLLDTNGQEILRLARSPVITQIGLDDISDIVEWQTPLSTGETYYSQVQFFEGIREPIMIMSVPLVNSQTDEVEMVVAGVMSFRSIWDIFSDLELEGNEKVFMINASGQVIAVSDPAFAVGDSAFDLKADQGRGEGLYWNDAIFTSDRIVFGDPQYGTAELIVISEQPYGEAAALAFDLVTVIIVATVIAFIAAIVLVILIVRQIVRPVEALSAAVQSITAGDISQRAEIVNDNEIGQLALAFNEMSQRIQDLISSLEERVNARTRDLKVAADVSRQVTTVLDTDRLLPQLTHLTLKGFDLNFASVFLYKPETQRLSMVACSGEAEHTMQTTGSSFHIDERPGLVAQAGREKCSIAINDVAASANHLPNPHLPTTKSELALPMLIGDKLIGVLDLQSERRGRFSHEDIEILTTLAEQIAIAVRNAQLYSDAREAHLRAEEANQFKSQFLANMSHELRTPLNAIVNFSQIMAMEILGPLNEEQKTTIDDVVFSSKHLLSLINDVLDISKIQSGMMNLFIEEGIDVKAIMDNALSTAKTLIDGKPIEILEDFDKQLPIITGDRRRIQQILLNLVSNAAKFTTEGSITLSAKWQADKVLFGIMDTGSGIAEEDIELIFEPFTQTDEGAKLGGGTGLGLPISKSLVEAHGGEMWVESEVGDGSSFFFTLPITSDKLSLKLKGKAGTDA